MVKWAGKGKDSPEVERLRRRVMKQADRDRRYRRRLQAIKDKLDLYGEEKLTPGEQVLVSKHLSFFYPRED